MRAADIVVGRRRRRRRWRDARWVVRILIAWALNAAALWVASRLFSGVRIHGTSSYLVAAGVLALANAVLKPVLTILTLPLVLVSLGAFLLLINVAMVALAAWAAPHMTIAGFWDYVGTVVVVWAVNWAARGLVARTGL